MNLSTRVLCGAVLIAATLLAQPIKSWSSQEDYCRDNRDAPLCKDGKPIDVQKSMRENWEAATKPWCQMNPDDELCGGKGTAKAKPPVARARTSAPRTAPAQTVVAPGPERAQEILPRTRRTKGSPSDIRLGEWDWRLVEPNADLLIGINMANLVESELARTLIRQWTGKLGQPLRSRTGCSQS